MKILKFETYIALAKNSVGSNTWRNLFVESSENKKDILENGNLSCAYFVSSVLMISGLLKSIHATVSGLEKALERDGWQKISDSENLKEGDVLIWERIKNEKGKFHDHVGFYLGGEEAISNDSKKGTPAIHDKNFGESKRKIVGVYRFDFLKNDK